ncbi:MAG: hypothetical protein WCW14_01740 [Candidatus Paceibacterota bacterium]|jgi:hypothetical protein
MIGYMESLEKSERNIKIEVEGEFDNYIPKDFIDDPVGYFERFGENIKKGNRKIDDKGVIRDDPTAVKDLPVWRNQEGLEKHVVGKLVNIDKGNIRKTGDPFYEYKVLQRLNQLRLPSAKIVARVEQDGMYLILMERIPGLRWHELKSLNLGDVGYSEEDINILKCSAEKQMGELRERFEELGIVRNWELKDMVIEIDIPNKKIISIIPTDWERTKII